jgi:hypothetical protein
MKQNFFLIYVLYLQGTKYYEIVIPMENKAEKRKAKKKKKTSEQLIR